MVEIKTVTVDSVAEKVISISNGQIARKFTSFNWEKIRIGIRWRAVGTETLYGVPRLAVGLCSMDQSVPPNLFGDPTTDHFFGMQTETPQYVYNASEGYYAFGNEVVMKQSSGSFSVLDASAGSFRIPVDSQNIFGCLFLDYERTAPNTYTLTLNVYNEARPALNMTKEAFEELMEQESIGSLNSPYIFDETNNPNLVTDEATYGTFNGLNICWKRSGAALEIASILVSRLK